MPVAWGLTHNGKPALDLPWHLRARTRLILASISGQGAAGRSWLGLPGAAVIGLGEERGLPPRAPGAPPHLHGSGAHPGWQALKLSVL